MSRRELNERELIRKRLDEHERMLKASLRRTHDPYWRGVMEKAVERIQNQRDVMELQEALE